MKTMGILRELCEALKVAPDGKVVFDCGCLARPTMFIPCVYHRREFRASLLAACEEPVEECQDGCCDPA